MRHLFIQVENTNSSAVYIFLFRQEDVSEEDRVLDRKLFACTHTHTHLVSESADLNIDYLWAHVAVFPIYPTPVF